MYLFDNDQEEMRKIIKKFVKQYIEPGMIERNNGGIYPKEITDKLGSLGYLSMPVSPGYGGSGLDMVSSMMIINEIGKSDPSIAHIISGINFAICYPIEFYGTEEQKQNYLVPCAKGEKVGVLAFNEPDGAGRHQINTLAVEDGDYYVISGTKTMITNTIGADFSIMVAKVEDKTGNNHRYNAFIVDLKNQNITVGKEEELMGLQSLKISEIHYDGVRIHKSSMLGPAGEAFDVIVKSMELMRLGVASVALGIAQRAYSEALSYTKIRKINNVLMSEMPTILFKLAEMKSNLASMEISVFYTAYLCDSGAGDIDYKSSIAKLFVTEKAKEICDSCLQIFGGYGYIKGYILEKLYRDVRAMTIVAGTSELLKSCIARGIMQNRI